MPEAVNDAKPLGARRIRATRQGAAVDAALRDADGFRTARDLYDELRRRGASVGLTTVYRHLKVLADAGEIDVVHQPEGEAQYRLCAVADASDEHHHHIVCRVCGRSVEVESPEVEAWAQRVAEAAGYSDVTHTVEVFGLCSDHAARSKRAGGKRR